MLTPVCQIDTRLQPHQAFLASSFLNHLQYTKVEGGGLGDFITVMWLMMVDTQGVAANKEPQGPSCNILSKDLRLECSIRNSSVNTACCSVELWPKPPNFLLSVYLMLSHVMKFPRPSPSGLCTIEVIKDWRWKWPGNEANVHRILVWDFAARFCW